jgi:hypothetical protein
LGTLGHDGNPLRTIKIHSPHLLSSLGQKPPPPPPPPSCNSQKISKPHSKNRRFPESKNPYRANGLVVGKDGYRRDFFPIFWQPWIIFENPRFQTKVFYFSFFLWYQEFGEYFGKKRRKIVQFALGRKFPKNFITFWSEKPTKFVPTKKTLLRSPRTALITSGFLFLLLFLITAPTVSDSTTRDEACS